MLEAEKAIPTSSMGYTPTKRQRMQAQNLYVGLFGTVYSRLWQQHVLRVVSEESACNCEEKEKMASKISAAATLFVNSVGRQLDGVEYHGSTTKALSTVNTLR